ncbi:DUF2993 domain-containing protein [Coleofasciculus sp. FACHB-SPT36]|uniref:LmeA family phospholipid-binding protein n=1 Tax=Cyanophyceae TaxID=3028117 RepID=UPI00168A76EE|nr:DUF2993 domain-containing protein [Coleofasciculus sp. FACHB-SPT36]MBD2539873.1 DUF2993 domain-containing protein [Coleofasciculus sp. FACHB-SPT36]
MEFIAIFLSGLLALVSPANLAIDRIAENAIRSQFGKVEQLQVRVDNAPNFQIVQGKVERVRIGGRGLWVTPEFRIAELEMETDPINLDVARLRQKRVRPTELLKEPLQAGVRLVITQQDINQALQSPAVSAQLRKLGSRILGSNADMLVQRYEFVNPQVEFLGDNRLRFQLELQEPGNADKLVVSVESGLGIVAEHQLQLIEPNVLVNGMPVPPLLLASFVSGLNSRLDLRTLEDRGIAARLLKLDLNQEQLELAAFVRVEKPDTASASTPR